MSGAGEGRGPASPETRLAERATRLARLADRSRDPAPVLRAPCAAEALPETGPGVVRPAEPAAVVPFQRVSDRRGSAREASLPSDLGRLPGAGPGLIWALEHAGIRTLADLAAGSPEALADRMGPIGGLIDFTAWIGFARRTGAGGGDPGETAD